LIKNLLKAVGYLINIAAQRHQMIENIFPTPVYKIQYSGDLAELQQTVMPVLEKLFESVQLDNENYIKNSVTTDYSKLDPYHPYHPNSRNLVQQHGLTSYHTVRNLHTVLELQTYTEFLKKHLDIFWDYLGYKGRPKIQDTWANRYTTNSFIALHDHAVAPLAVAFYLKKPKDASNIIFVDQNISTLQKQPYAETQTFERELVVEEGDLVIFPGWVKHRTAPSASTQERIAICSNIKMEN